MTTTANDVAVAALTQLAEVKGQLAVLTQMIQSNHDATHQRINDFRTAVEGRFGGVEDRLNTLEHNERGTAIRTAGVAALTGALVSAGMALIKR